MRLASLFLGGVLSVGAVGLGGGCTASVGYEYDAEVEPPPPQQEVIEERPGYVYLRGNWYRHDSQWAWRAGHYEAVREGYAYRDGRWARQGNRWHYEEGNWERRPAEETGKVIIRDHRREEPPPRP